LALGVCWCFYIDFSFYNYYVVPRMIL
jgi:hypothetical protein